MVKRLRHRPFTAVTGVQIPLESFVEVQRKHFKRIWFRALTRRKRFGKLI